MATTIATRKAYGRSSFDRFGDDLCGHLLSYLPIADKLRFECVCRQWRSVIFQHQKILVINEYSMCVLDMKSKLKFRQFEGFDEDLNVIKLPKCLLERLPNTLRQLFRKFKNITGLQIIGFNIYDELMQILIDECTDRLTSIDISVDDIDHQLFARFADKFGQTLTAVSLRNINDEDLEAVLKKSPNLRTIFLFNDLSVLLKQFLPKLHNIYQFYYSHKDDNKDNTCESFADNYKNQIINLRSDLFLPLYDNFMSNISRSQFVSRFANLRDIYIRFSRSEDFDANCLQPIADSCQQLSVLRLSVFSFTFNAILFKIVAKFHSLTDLTLNSYEYVSPNGVDSSHQTVIEKLTVCSNIRYFSLNTIGLNDDDLSVIFHCFPHLKKFLLDCRTDGFNITDKTLENLSKLEDLTKLSLKTHKYFPYISDGSMAQFLNKCQTVTNISVRYNLQSMQPIQQLIRTADKWSKMTFRFDFCVKSLPDYIHQRRQQLSMVSNVKLFAFNTNERQDFVCCDNRIWKLDNDYDRYKYWFF